MAMLAWIIPVEGGGLTPSHPIVLPPTQPPGIWPSPGYPAHPIAPGGPPPTSDRVSTSSGHLAQSRIPCTSHRSGRTSSRYLAVTRLSQSSDLLAAFDLALAWSADAPYRGPARAGDLAGPRPPQPPDLLPAGDLAESGRPDPSDRSSSATSRWWWGWWRKRLPRAADQSAAV
jgi:hypothetical protein